MSLSVDVTDKRRAEAERARLQVQLQEAQKLESLGVLAGGIAHDFNNLLLVITANTEMAQLGMGADARAASRHLEDVMRAAERAADLCRQMLAYAGRGRVVVERVDLSALVSEMAQLVTVSISKHVQLQRALASDLLAIEADPTQLRQVVLNLLTNASDAIGDQPGVISVTTRHERLGTSELQSQFGADLAAGAYVVLEVADTGRGLDPVSRARMFEPFFSTKANGRGLGLSATLGITMPILGGEATLRELRARAPALPVIMMSGYVETVPREDHVQFLAKPFRVDDLLEVVAQVLGDRSDDGRRLRSATRSR